MIFPGFFGCSKMGILLHFQEAQIFQAQYLQQLLAAEVYENFTDVDSVFAADPKMVENPKPIPVFTYKEMRELAYSGFSVLHEETFEPVYRKKSLCV